MNVVKKVIDVIVDPWTYIYNFSFTTRSFPHQMKIDKVTPVFKAGDSFSLLQASIFTPVL